MQPPRPSLTILRWYRELAIDGLSRHTTKPNDRLMLHVKLQWIDAMIESVTALNGS